MDEFKFTCSQEEWEQWRHSPVTKEAKRYLKHLEETLKNDWADGLMVGKTQEETGYLSMQGLAKVTVLENVIRDIFETEEEAGNGK